MKPQTRWNAIHNSVSNSINDDQVVNYVSFSVAVTRYVTKKKFKRKGPFVLTPPGEYSPSRWEAAEA